MLPTEWIVFLIAFMASLLKALYEGRGSKSTVGFIILLTIAAAIIGVIFSFVFSFILNETFQLTASTFTLYLVDAFIGAIIIPISKYLLAVKIE